MTAQLPLHDPDGFVDTGDRVQLRDGRAYFVGRAGGIINVGKLLADEPIDLLDGKRLGADPPQLLGLLLGIMPWNYPYYQVARFAGPNLVIGNTVLLKHAPQCPESAAAMEQIFHEAGFPEDAYINIYATNGKSSG